MRRQRSIMVKETQCMGTYIEKINLELTWNFIVASFKIGNMHVVTRLIFNTLILSNFKFLKKVLKLTVKFQSEVSSHSVVCLKHLASVNPGMMDLNIV